MVIAVRTESGPDGLTIVKSAETDVERLRLANEAELLTRAAHPGVVEIVEVSPDELRLRHAGTPLVHLLPLPADHAAAVVCAVAEVLDAVHGAGVAHGQVDADHIVLDDTGRPRVCGFGRATAIDDRRAEAATEDIADLGALFDRLLDEAAHIPWTAANAGHRHRTRRKHARELFRDVAGMAQRQDPRQRISPHQMANAIRDALPTLDLPTPPRRAVDSDGIPIPGMRDITDDNGDTGWSPQELRHLATEAEDDEFGPGRTAADVDDTVLDVAMLDDSGIDEEPASTVAEPVTPVGSVEPIEPAAAVEPTRPVPPVEPSPEPAGEVAAVHPDPGPDTDGTGSDDESWTPINWGDDHAPDDQAPDDVDGDGVQGAAEFDTPASPEPDRDARARLEKALSSGPPPITIRESSIEPGQRRRRREPEPEPSSQRRRIGMALVVVFVAGLIIAPLTVILYQSFRDSPESVTSENTAPTTTLPGTPSSWPDTCDLPELTGPDMDGDGCPETITVNGRNVQVGNVPIAFGEDGDLVAVGDTDCDGVMTPFLLRPSTGQVFVWSEWPLETPVDVRSAEQVSGATGIERRDGAKCDVIVVTGSGDTVVAGTP